MSIKSLLKSLFSSSDKSDVSLQSTQQASERDPLLETRPVESPAQRTEPSMTAVTGTFSPNAPSSAQPVVPTPLDEPSAPLNEPAPKPASSTLYSSGKSPVHYQSEEEAPLDEHSFDAHFMKAEQGNPHEQYLLAQYYLYGTDVLQDYAKAYLWLNRAAVQGHAQAQNALGDLFFAGHGCEQSLQEATKWYTRSADQNCPEGLMSLGKLYEKGLGVDLSPEKAFQYYLQAAQLGEAQAQAHIAECYQTGHGVEENLTLAVEWYTRAAEQNNAQAHYALGVLSFKGEGLEADQNVALEHFKAAAQGGNASAQLALAQMAEYGTLGEVDLDEAIYWWKMLSEGGSGEAAYHLYELYKNPPNQAFPADLGEALNYCETAVSLGYPDAFCSLGQRYLTGDGVEADTKHAYDLLVEGYHHNDSGSIMTLGYLYENGLVVEKNEAAARELYRIAEKLGNENAALCLARLDGEATETVEAPQTTPADEVSEAETASTKETPAEETAFATEEASQVTSPLEGHTAANAPSETLEKASVQSQPELPLEEDVPTLAPSSPAPEPVHRASPFAVVGNEPDAPSK